MKIFTIFCLLVTYVSWIGYATVVTSLREHQDAERQRDIGNMRRR